MIKDERIVPLYINPSIFVSKKPIAVIFGDERLNVKSWREVFTVILKHCNMDEEHHKTLMYLRDKISGKCRTFLSHSPDGMRRPVQIDKDMYAETHYGSQTLMHILVERILKPVGFDYTYIEIIIRY